MIWYFSQGPEVVNFSLIAPSILSVIYLSKINNKMRFSEIKTGRGFNRFEKLSEPGYVQTHVFSEYWPVNERYNDI